MDSSAAPCFRFSVLYACAWRLVSEVFRCGQAGHDLRVHQYFPSLSGHGILELTAGPFEEGGSKLSFDLGGGGNGAISVRPRGSPEPATALAGEARGEAQPVPRFVWELLTDPDVDGMVARLMTEAGWATSPTKPATNGPVLAARSIARFLERYMAAPLTYRTTPAWIDNQQCGVWQLEALQELLPEEWRSTSTDDGELARRHVLLHGGPSPDPPPLTSWSRELGPAVLIDLGTARAIPLHAPERRVDLLADYRAHGHRLGRTVAWLEEAMGAP